MELWLTSVDMLYCFCLAVVMNEKKAASAVYLLSFMVLPVVAPASFFCECMSRSPLHDPTSWTVAVMELLKTHHRMSLGLAVEVCSRFFLLACKELADCAHWCCQIKGLDLGN